MKQIRVSRSWATRAPSFIAWKYRSATLRSDSVPWKATIRGSSSGRIGRITSGVPSLPTQGAVAVDLDELSPASEEQDRAELRVEAAADDQLVAGTADHRLDRHPAEVAGAGVLSDRGLDRAIGAADGFGVGQVEPHAADV